jgi:hypothetical protein
MYRVSTIGVALFAALSAFAQTTTPTAPSTCTTPPTAFTALNIEHTLTLGASGVFSTNLPNIPQSILDQVTAGTVQLREAIRLDTSQTPNILTITGFTADPSAPSPVPPNTIQSSQVLSSQRVAVDNVSFSCSPVPSALIVGHVLTNNPNTPWGNSNNALVAVGFGYTTDNPPKINNITVLLPGIAGLYSQAAVGTLTFPTSPVTPPGSAGNAPVIVWAQNPIPPTAQRQIILDVSQSTDPNGNVPLTFSWVQVNTNVQAGIANANTATPLVTFNGKGDYTFMVTVTNTKGVSSTAQITVTYYGR